MTSENKRELNHEELGKISGGQIGETARYAVCPTCLCNLENGRFTRPGWERYNPVLKQNVSVYVDGFICPKCGYNAEFLELPFFTVTEKGLKLVPQEKQKTQ